MTDAGFICVIQELKKIKTLNDVHINVGQTALTGAIIEPLTSFLLEGKDNLKKFDISTMW